MQRHATASSDSFDLHYDSHGRLVLTDSSGVEHVDVDPTRAFPVSDPHRKISIRNRQGHELLWIDDLSKLPPALRALLEDDLRKREFIPIITRIVHMTAYTEPSQWDVETDRGRTQFLLNNEDDVHRLDNHRAVIVDSHGTRYFIPDTRRLDPHSRRVLERYL